MKNLNPIVVGIVFTLITFSAMAREIEKISLNSSVIKVGKSVEIIINLKANDSDSSKNQAATSIQQLASSDKSEVEVNLPCAVQIEFGDGEVDHVRIDGDSPSLKITHTYPKAGTYKVIADGKAKFRGLKSVLGCSGDAQTVTANVLSEDIADINTSNNKPVSDVSNTLATQPSLTGKNSVASTEVKATESVDQEWISDKNGCKVLRHNYSGPGVGVIWSGKCKDGYADGYGVLTWQPNETRYEGNFTQGSLNGKGSYKDKNGTTYVGNFVNDYRSGDGIITYSDGTYYVGNFAYNTPITYKSYDKKGNIVATYVDRKLVQPEKVNSVEASNNTFTSSNSDVLFDIISGITGIVVQNKINHDVKRQANREREAIAQQQAAQQAQAEQQSYENARAQLNAQRAQEIQANTESMNSLHTGTTTTTASASNNNVRNVANNSQTTTPVRKPPQAPCTSTTTYNDVKGTPYSDVFMRGNTIFAKVIPNTSYGADCSISFTLNGNSRTLYLNNIPGNAYSEALVGNYAESMSVQWDNIYSSCGLSQYERDRRETVRKQEIFKCQVDRR